MLGNWTMGKRAWDEARKRTAAFLSAFIYCQQDPANKMVVVPAAVSGILVVVFVKDIIFR